MLANQPLLLRENENVTYVYFNLFLLQVLDDNNYDTCLVLENENSPKLTSLEPKGIKFQSCVGIKLWL